MTEKEKQQVPLLILRRNQVEERTGLKRSTLYEQIKKGDFPSPIKIGIRAVGWIDSEIQAWLESRVKVSAAPGRWGSNVVVGVKMVGKGGAAMNQAN